jgi:hypothetical protein
LTQIDVAEAFIRAAVRLFFEGWNIIAVYTLANSARGIVATIEHIDVETVQQELAVNRGGGAGMPGRLVARQISLSSVKAMQKSYCSWRAAISAGQPAVCPSRRRSMRLRLLS